MFSIVPVDFFLICGIGISTIARALLFVADLPRALQAVPGPLQMVPRPLQAAPEPLRGVPGRLQAVPDRPDRFPARLESFQERQDRFRELRFPYFLKKQALRALSVVVCASVASIERITR